MKLFNKLKQQILSFSNDSGSIAIESAILLPVLLFCGLGASEVAMALMNTNSITDMTISYANILSKQGGSVTEKSIRDLVDKSAQSSDRPDFMTKGRVIMTAVDMPIGGAAPKKLWQRCSGQPAGKSFVSSFSGTDLVLPAGALPLTEGHSYIFVETFYDSQPLTGFFYTAKDADGKRLKRLKDFKTSMARPGSEFSANVTNPEGISNPASSACG
jgi:hypothetical protein